MMSLIRSAVARLTLYYLTIIAGLSIGFSIIVYNISSYEFDRPKQPQVVRQLNDLFLGDYTMIQGQLADESRTRLKQHLILWNVSIVVLGAAGSYVFARRTLRPIDQALERQGRFVSDASHELRTPLTAIQTETEVGLRDPGLTLQDAKALLASNLEEVARLSALTNGLLELSTSERVELALEPVQLTEAVGRAIVSVEPARSARGSTITSEVGDHMVRANPQRLEQVLVILLDNAIKYSPEDAQITVRAQQRGKLVELQVHDTGSGIAPADLDHIFDRFYRADSSRSTQHVQGHGLGLSIARQIIQAHGGTITAQSVPDQGTTFTVRLATA